MAFSLGIRTISTTINTTGSRRQVYFLSPSSSFFFSFFSIVFTIC
jgi:hypothetical protein